MQFSLFFIAARDFGYQVRGFLDRIEPKVRCCPQLGLKMPERSVVRIRRIFIAARDFGIKNLTEQAEFSLSDLTALFAIPVSWQRICSRVLQNTRVLLDGGILCILLRVQNYEPQDGIQDRLSSHNIRSCQSRAVNKRKIYRSCSYAHMLTCLFSP